MMVERTNMAAQRNGGKREQETEGTRGDAAPCKEALHTGNSSCAQEQWLYQWARCHTHRAGVAGKEWKYQEGLQDIGHKLDNELTSSLPRAQGPQGSSRGVILWQ